VQVIAVWSPGAFETTPEIMRQWTDQTSFVLPCSPLLMVRTFFTSLVRHPIRMAGTLRLALATSRPGLRGFVYQLVYFMEAVLAADIMRRKAIDHVHNHIGDQSGTVTMLAANLAGIGYSITFHGWPVFFDANYYRLKEKILGARFTRAISFFCRSQLMMFSDRDDPSTFKVVHCW